MSSEIRIDNVMEFRSVDTEKREVEGIAVPFDKVIEFAGMQESFSRGAIESVAGAKLAFRHGEVIGVITHGEETDEGYLIRATISDTVQGRDAWTLVKDGAITQFSVGFKPVKTSQRGGVNVREKVELREVSLVPWGAYGENASISEFREEANAAPVADITNNKENNMNHETNAPEVDELREQVSDLERKFAVLSDGPSTATVENRSGGELLKALATGDAEAKRAFADSTDAGVKTAWVNEGIKLVDENRDVLNLFSRAPLPASGNSVEYPKLGTTTGTVGVQALEGDLLPYMEVTITSATAPVVTYGGYSSLSRQAIERTDIAYLEAVLEYQATQYARATNAAVVTAVNTNWQQGVDLNTSLVNGTATGASVISALLDARKRVKAANSKADYVLVDETAFEGLATIVDGSGRPVFDLNGDGSNTWGNVSVAAGQNVVGSIAGLQVVLSEDVSGVKVISREAIQTFESAGAPFRLQDEDILRLTKDFSLYGYMAVAVKNTNAIVTLNAGA